MWNCHASSSALRPKPMNVASNGNGTPGFNARDRAPTGAVPARGFSACPLSSSGPNEMTSLG